MISTDKLNFITDEEYFANLGTLVLKLRIAVKQHRRECRNVKRKPSSTWQFGYNQPGNKLNMDLLITKINSQLR